MFRWIPIRARRQSGELRVTGDRRVVAFEPVLLFIKADVAIHLTDILVGEFWTAVFVLGHRHTGAVRFWIRRSRRFPSDAGCLRRD
jgi:hypothetical protein